MTRSSSAVTSGRRRSNLMPWEVELVGLVDRPLRLTLEELGRLEQATKAAVLQSPATAGACTGRGDGRALGAGCRRAGGMVRRPPGRPAGEGRTPNGCGARAFRGRRCAAVAQDPRVRAQHPAGPGSRPDDDPRPEDEWRAFAGDPRRARRLVVPGWAGNNWSKWVRRIVVAREESPSFYMQTAYRMPRTPVPPGAAPAAVPLDPSRG